MSTNQMYFLYASNTGNAETICKQLHHQATHGTGALYPDAKCITLNDFEKLQLFKPVEGEPQKQPAPLTIVIVCSTTGDGEIPDNGGKFKRWLRNSPVSMSHVRYTVLALGDTNYNAFCQAGKFLDQKLEEYGAKRLYARGEADDAFGLDSVVDPWCTGLWDALRNSEAQASKQTFHVKDQEAPVLNMDVALDTLFLYDSSCPVVKKLALCLVEIILDFGGKASLLPISQLSIASLRRISPEAVIFLSSSHRLQTLNHSSLLTPLLGSNPDTATMCAVPSAATFGDMLTWLSDPSCKVVAYAQCVLGGAKQPAEAAVSQATSQIHNLMSQCKRTIILDLASGQHHPPSSIASALSVPSDDATLVGLEETHRWSSYLLDRLPGVTASIAVIHDALARPLKEFVFASDLCPPVSADGLDGGPLGASAHRRPVTGDSKRQPRPFDAMVRAVLTPVMFLYAASNNDPFVPTVAHDLQAELERQGIDSGIAEMSNFKSVGFPRRAFFVFIVSGCGPGGVLPKSLQKLLKSIKTIAADKRDVMGSVKFAILGLDSGADLGTTRTNFPALELECALQHMGSQKCHPTGLVDASDDMTLQQVVGSWSRSLTSSIVHPMVSMAYIDVASIQTNATSPAAPECQLQTSDSSGTWFPWDPVQLRRDVASQMNILILYSGSGMAKAVAQLATKEGTDLGFHHIKMRSFTRAAAYPASTISSTFVICFVECAPDGAHLSGGSSWKKHLKQRATITPDLLSHQYFAIAGLGTANPRHPAHAMAQLMSTMQGNRVFPITFIAQLSQVHTTAMPWFRGVLAAMSNLEAEKPSLSLAVRVGDRSSSTPQIAETHHINPPFTSFSILFLYGSVTGNAENIARDLHREALERGFQSRVASLNQFEKMKFLSTGVVVIVCCTTCSASGQSGALPENAKRFGKYLFQKQPSKDLLASLRFAVLGVGSTKYASTFCAAAKRIDDRLGALGGRRVLDAGFADDVVGLEIIVEQWRQKFFACVVQEAADRDVFGGFRIVSPEVSPSLRPAAASSSTAPPATSLDGGAPLEDSQPHPTPLMSSVAVMQTALPRNVLIMYGSQKGNAEAIARDIYDRFSLHTELQLDEVKCCSMNDFDSNGWRRFTFVIFVCSTTGDGEFPDNATLFHKFFIRQKNHPDDLLAGKKFAVLGLGDTNYSRFCQAARTLDRRLEELGASRFYARGEADDAYGLESVVEPWIDGLWAALSRAAVVAVRLLPQASTVATTTAVSEHAPTAVSESGKSTSNPQPRGDASDCSSSATQRALRKDTDSVSSVTARIASWERLTPESSDNTVILLNFEVPVATQWLPGDAISILPSNDAADVDEILRHFGCTGDEMFLPPTANGVSSLFPTSPIYNHIKYPITYREVLTHIVSLRIHRAGKQILSVFLLHTQDVAEQSLLSSWMMPSSAGKAGTSIGDNRLSLLDLLRKFHSSRPPFRHVVEYLMVLQRRPYSVCSAKIAGPTKLSICFKVVPHGVCTNWLLQECQRSASGQLVEMVLCFRPTPEFRMPQDPHVPLILIGPGTGVAPFVAFLEHREAIARQNGIPSGDVQLFFGCRTNANDYIFRERLSHFVANKSITTLHVAFSQEPNSGFFWYGGCYVQDKMQECSHYLCEQFVHRNAHVYVCGDAESMARDVHRVLIDIVEQHLQCSTYDATTFIQRMIDEGRYQRDIWTSSQ